MVTARHNVLRANEQYGNIWIRINTGQGDATDVEITGEWAYPDNPGSDVAAIPFMPFMPWEPLPIPKRWFVTEDIIEARKIGIGDELIVMGMFSAHVGTNRNLPIVRSGSIASMPQEPLIDPNTGDEFDAYLAEVRSIGGLSGSPVFVALNPATRLAAEVHEADVGGQNFYLLGLVRGHWDRSAELDFHETELGRLNTGVAMVTPITDLIPILETEEFVEYAKQMDKQHKDSEAYRQAEDTAPEESGSNGTSEFR